MMPKVKGKAQDGFVALNVGETLRKCNAAGFLVVDDQSQIIVVNPDAELLLGRPAKQMLNRPIEDLSLPQGLSELIKEVRSTGKKISDRQIVLPTPGPGDASLKVSAFPFQFSHKTSKGVAVSITDQGAARKLEHNMRRLDRLASIGTLSASMAHEIKNAMVPVKTFIDMLLQQNKDAPLASLVDKEIRRVDSIVSQMLRFSGPAKPSFAAVRIHDVLEQSLSLIQHQIEGRSIQIERQFKARNDMVGADAYQLEQAFLNLFFNSMEAMGPGGVLTIATSNPRGDSKGGEFFPLEVQISDTGIGIPKENMAHLFETFFTTKPNGTGLGLAITRRIVKEHNGNIHLQSKPNQGTDVTISLPLH